MRILLVTSILFLLGACTDYSETDQQNFRQKIVNYTDKKGISLQESTSGVFYQILEKGKGKEIKYTDKISVTYKGTLLNGEVFDERKEPISFNLRNLIPAWKEIIPGLKTGTKLQLITPPSMGYGSDEQEKIPANSILIFEIDLLSVE